MATDTCPRVSAGQRHQTTDFASALAYDPPYSDSKQAYKYIADNIESFVDEEITIRNTY